MELGDKRRPPRPAQLRNDGPLYEALYRIAEMEKDLVSLKEQIVILHERLDYLVEES